MKPLTALLIEDDEDFRKSLAVLVKKEEFEVVEAEDLGSGRAAIEESAPDVVFIDLRLPDGAGLDAVADEELRERTEFVVITGNASVDTAVEALRWGALDYLTKPVDRGRLRSVLANLRRTRELKGEVSELRGELRDLGRFGGLIGRSKAMQNVYDLISKVAPTRASVFVSGESGTGKELVARTVHRLSPRRKDAFFAINCGAMAPNVIESELFGHEKGSFTGADRQRKGHFEQASGGTLFLDEITEMPLDLQVKLLRALETGQVMRVGGGEAIKVDVRVIAASNRDPESVVKAGLLREDLYYRLNVFPISLPPLRERDADVDLLAEAFLAEMNAQEGAEKRWSQEALDQLRQMRWPGNVRELKNAVQRAFIMAGDVVRPSDLPHASAPGPQRVTQAAADESDEGSEASGASGGVLRVRVCTPVADVERELILATLEHLDGNKKAAAERLGISLKTLYNRLNVYRASGAVS